MKEMFPINTEIFSESTLGVKRKRSNKKEADYKIKIIFEGRPARVVKFPGIPLEIFPSWEFLEINPKLKSIKKSIGKNSNEIYM